jgi:hypothetical protein
MEGLIIGRKKITWNAASDTTQLAFENCKFLQKIYW